MPKMTQAEARAILRNCGIEAGSDFHGLHRNSVLALIECAKARGYRKPKHANGSTGRYFHAYVDRVARRGEPRFTPAQRREVEREMALMIQTQD